MSTCEVPAVIAGNVNLLRFSEALARAGIVGRHDADRGVLVIEPAVAPPARCVERALATENLVVRDDADRGVVLIEPAGLLPDLFSEDVRRGVDWYNRLSEAERLHWHQVAGSNMPADCWDAFKCGMTLPD